MGSLGINIRPITLSDAGFMIEGIYKYHLFGQEFWFTTTTLSLIIVTVLILILAVLARRVLVNACEVPGGVQNAIEYGFELLEAMADNILGKYAPKFINYIGTIFIFIFVANFSGLIGLRPPTADYGVTFLLGIFTFLIVNYQGIKNRKFRHVTSLFEPMPIFFPLNLIGEISNPISISMRLFANMLSGVVIMGLWYSMMPIFLKIGIPAALHAYTDVFSGAIQTYVFCMLTMVFISDKME